MAYLGEKMQGVAWEEKYAAQTKIPTPAVTSQRLLEGALRVEKFAAELAGRAETLAQRLLGPVPEDASTAGGDGPPNGLLGHLQVMSSAQYRALQRLHEALARMEAEID